MKYYDVVALKPGLIVGEKICDMTGIVLLKEGDILSSQDISYLSFLGIKGVNILDDGIKHAISTKIDSPTNKKDSPTNKKELTTSKVISEKEVVKPKLRENAVNVVKDFFKKGSIVELPKVESKIEKIVSQVVSDVMSQKDVVMSMTEIKTYDEYTYSHSVDVGILSGIIGAKYGLSDTSLREVVTSGFLHDIGKVFIDPDIVNAPRKLNEEERIKMMDHPSLGYKYITSHYNFSPNVSRAVYEHHEWFNGMGYPNRKKGEGIHIHSRILKAADVYNAMTTRRPYHPPYLPCEVMEYIMGRSGMEFDPDVVTIMARKFNVYPLGCEIELSDGVRARVIKNNEHMMLRPVVQSLKDDKIIDLLKDKSAWNKTIVKMFI